MKKESVGMATPEVNFAICQIHFEILRNKSFKCQNIFGNSEKYILKFGKLFSHFSCQGEERKRGNGDTRS